MFQRGSLLIAEKFTEVLNQQREEKAEKDRERVRLLTADPFDPEAQRLIAEEIRQENNFRPLPNIVRPEA